MLGITSTALSFQLLLPLTQNHTSAPSLLSGQTLLARKQLLCIAYFGQLLVAKSTHHRSDD
jgi:hypothetical protein